MLLAEGSVGMPKKTLVAVAAIVIIAFSLFAVFFTVLRNIPHQVKPIRDDRDIRQAGEAVDVASDFAGEKMFHVDMDCQRLHLPTSERLKLKHAVYRAYLAESARVRASDYTSPFNPAVLDQDIPGRSENQKKLYEALDQNIHQQLQKDERLHLGLTELDRRVDSMNKAGEAEINRADVPR